MRPILAVAPVAAAVVAGIFTAPPAPRAPAHRPASAASARAHASTAPRHATVAPAAQATPRWTADRLLAETRRRYRQEVHGGKAFGRLHQVGRDRTLRGLVRSGSAGALRSYLARMYPAVWYHWHVSRVRVLSGSRLVAEAGVPFVLPGPTMTLGGPNGSPRTLQVSIQDEIGIVRYMSKNYPANVVIRGRGAGHVLTSLPAALGVQLPDSGTRTIGGVRYRVRSFAEVALDHEPVRVWVLRRA